MKRLSILFSPLIGLVMCQPVFAYKEADLQRLLQTNSCEQCDLSGATLVGWDLSGASLNGANLSWAYLYKAKLVNADLVDANLEGARLSDADLTDARLVGARISLAANQQDRSPTKKFGILIQEEGVYPEITSFDLNGTSKYMTSKSGKLYKSKRGELTRYGDYVRNYPDLLAAYKKSTGITIDEWGKRHWEKYGQYKRNRKLKTLPAFEVVLDLNHDPKFRSDEEVGLLSVVTRNNLIYLSYTIQEGGDTRENVYLVVDEYSEKMEKIRTVVKIRTASFSHVAGTLAFDRLGKLYLSVGEGRISDYESQNVDSFLGKILRIDVSQEHPEPEVMAYGLRNPWKISIDSTNRMFIGDCGEATIESVYLLDDLYPTMPYNLGWPVFEGTKRIMDDPLRFADTLAPIYEYKHHSGIGICVIGGFFLDDLGVYVFGDYLGRLRLLKEHENGRWYEIHSQSTRGVLSLGMDVNNNKTYMSGWDNIYQLVIEKEKINSYPWAIVCNTTMPDGTVNNSGC